MSQVSPAAPSSPCLLGAHTSAAGGPANALLEGATIGATMVQLFTANQRRWEHPPLAATAVEAFKQTKERLGMEQLMSHASYLLNLGSPLPEGRTKSCHALAQEISRCQALGITLLNFHPGAALQGSREACLEHVVASMCSMAPHLPDGRVTLLIEMTAGQGSNVGCTLEEVAYLVTHTKGKVPVGVCVDTCHIFVAGYDVRTPQGWDTFLAAFGQQVGMSYLHAFHLNDAKHPCGTRKDRHAPLGEGTIGKESFRYLMRHPATRSLPKVLETPGGPPVWTRELRELTHWGREGEP